MSVWQILGLVFVAGGLGGLVNSLISDKGLALPHTVSKGDGTSILVPGFIGNMLIGSLAASVSWLLYGPLNQVSIAAVSTITLAVLGGAVLVGMSGSGWFANAISKNVLTAAASQAAAAPAAPAVSQQMLQSTPVEILNLARQMNEATSSITSAETPTSTKTSVIS